MKHLPTGGVGGLQLVDGFLGQPYLGHGIAPGQLAGLQIREITLFGPPLVVLILKEISQCSPKSKGK
jgi:hypothetical protein